MGIALGHEVKPARATQSAKRVFTVSPRSKLGRPGMRGGFRKSVTG